MNVIILAGGKGSRLAPWPAPKCLLPINGVPILYRLLEYFLITNSPHINDVTICVGYRARDINEAVERFRMRAWVSLSKSDEDELMGSRLLRVRDKSIERTLICYGDELADVDLKALLATHEGCAMTFTASPTKVPGGTVVIENGAPYIVENSESLVNIGFVVVEPQCWDHLREDDGLSDWINRVREADLRVGIHRHYGKRATVNSLADLKYAEEVWK